MKRYDELVNLACLCVVRATDARNKGDTNMQRFWNNAYEGFKIKATKLLQEEDKEVNEVY